MDPFQDLPPQLQRKLESALMQQQLQAQLGQQAFAPRPTEYTPGGTAVKQSPLEHLVRALTGGIHQYSRRAYGKQAEDVLAEGAEGRRADMTKVMEALAGKPGMHTLPPDQAGPQVPAVPGDPQAAISTALQSQYPSVQAQGFDIQKRMLDQRQKIVEELMKGSTPASLQQVLAGSGPAALRPKPQYQTLGDSIVTTDSNRPGVTPLTQGRFEQSQLNLGGMQVPSNIDTYTGKETPTAGLSVQGNPALASMSRLSEFDLKQIDKGRESAQKVAQSLGVIESLSQELQKAYTSGSLAEERVAVNKFVNLIGGVPRAEDVNAEYIQSLLNKLSIADAKALGVNPSNRDIEIIKQSIGSINTDPNALPRILEVSYRLNAEALGRYNGFVSRAEQAEQRLNPTADYGRYQIYSPENPESDPLGALRGLMARPTTPKPAPPPSGRRRISVTGN